MLVINHRKGWFFPLKIEIFHSYVAVYQRVSPTGGASFWCRKSLRFLRVNHDRQPVTTKNPCRIPVPTSRAIGTQLNAKLWKYLHGKSMENMDHMFINMFINCIYMWNSWKIHGTSMEHPAFLEAFHAEHRLLATTSAAAASNGVRAMDITEVVTSSWRYQQW